MEKEYEDIEVMLSEQDKLTLVDSFVRTKLSGASQSIFYKTKDNQANSPEDALYHAVINEMILKALLDEIESKKEPHTHTFMTDSEIERQKRLIRHQY